VDPFHERLVAVFPRIRQILSRLLDPLELEGIDSTRPVLATCLALGYWLEQKPHATWSDS
jgi:hypothetical protein